MEVEDKLEELRELGIYYKPIPLEFLGNTVCSPSLSEEILGQDLEEDQAFATWISTVAVGIGGLYFHQAPQCCVITDKKVLYHNLRNVFQSDSELHFFNQVDEFCHKINQAYPNGEEFTAGEHNLQALRTQIQMQTNYELEKAFDLHYKEILKRLKATKLPLFYLNQKHLYYIRFAGRHQFDEKLDQYGEKFLQAINDIVTVDL